jgi:septal ring factor EnvC (AmiA/AmiB activator)
MPQQKNSSSIYLQLHQLASEKERLKKELQTLHDRSQQVLQRLDDLERECTKLEAEATESGAKLDDSLDRLKADLIDASGAPTKSLPERKPKPKNNTNATNNTNKPSFKSMSIDY